MSSVSASSINILCIGYSWFPESPGGLARYTYELTKQMAVGEDQIELAGVGLPENLANSAVKLTKLAELESSLLRRLMCVRKNFLSRNRRKDSKPDAINLHFALTSLPLLTSLPDDIPVIFTFHGPWAVESQQEGAYIFNIWVKYWIERYVYHRCDRFIVLSKAFGKVLHETYSVPWEKIHIIPGGVDINHFKISLSRYEARSKLNWPQDRTILFTTRRLVHRMGLDKLLQALVAVKAKGLDVWLAIAGKGPLRETLEQLIRDLSLEENVKFLGFLPDEDLPVAYQAANLTVMPSQSLEGFGLVLLESLACGTPALCTPVGGMPEVVEPFNPALVTQSADETAIAERLVEFLTGRLELPSRETCREYAVNNFDWKEIAQRVRQVLLA